jgi:arsenate reductase (thioredoxin)
MNCLRRRIHLDRNLVVLAVLVLLGMQWPTPSVAADAPLAVHKVVFVCEHGSVKSLVAASYFNRNAQSRGLPYRAVARGTAPEPTVPGSVRAGLREIGVDVSSYVPQLFRVADLEDASLVVSFDQDITATVGGRVRHLKWDSLPAVLVDYIHGRDAIVKKVDLLIEVLAQGHSP